METNLTSGTARRDHYGYARWLSKVKAQVVIIGFKHPDLVKRDPVTNKPELLTASPTISRTCRNLLLQSIAFDKHSLKSADAESAFLQADNLEEGRTPPSTGSLMLPASFGRMHARSCERLEQPHMHWI